MQRATIALIFTCTFSVPAYGQVFESVGPRALGMGGAFVGVADDGTATYWNPAGLATGAILDLCGGYTRGDHGPREDSGGPLGGESAGRTFCLAVPSIGLSYNRLRVTSAGGPRSSTGGDPAGRQDLRPDEVGVSSLVTRQWGLTLVQSVAPGLAIGTTLKWVRGSFAAGAVPRDTTRDEALEQAGELQGPTDGALDLDVGIMAAGGPMRVGLVVRNMREPGFESSAGEKLTLHRQVRVGVAVMPGGEGGLNVADEHGLVFSLDADLTTTATAWGDRRQVAVGAERWWAGRRLGLRAGARASTVGAARPVATAGFSLGLTRGIYVEAAGTRGHRDGDRGWAVGMRVGY